MHGKLLNQSVMEPSVVLVPPADATPTAGRGDVVRREGLNPLELLLLLRVPHLYTEWGGVGLPHGGIWERGGGS